MGQVGDEVPSDEVYLVTRLCVCMCSGVVVCTR